MQADPWCRARQGFKSSTLRHITRIAFAGSWLTGILLDAREAHAAWPPPLDTPIERIASPDFWPSDPEYAYGAWMSPRFGIPGQWWLYSFVPDRAPNALFLREPGLASGLSVDAAWRYGTGKNSVVLAFIDDGIDWSQSEVIGSVVLNWGELPHKIPLHRDGTECAPLIPNDPNSPRFDCSSPPDGVVTIEDFVDAMGAYPGGAFKDTNGNQKLDPGDLIAVAADGLDNDNNGVTDDIAGWNFSEGNDNPGLVLSTHGTEAMLDALAKANNGEGRAGVCPNCLGIPIRITDQRGVDPQRLALAIFYAASRGASAALVGHLPASRSEGLEKAIQNASQRGMLVVMPQDGERQGRPSLSFNTDSWLSVASLTTSGESASPIETTSFVASDPCQTFASGTNYAGAGVSCGRRSASTILGIAGLVVSGAKLDSGPARLSANEVASTLESTSDVIDTNLTSPTESSSRGATIRRINANSAVAAVGRGLVAPELDITRPSWNEPLLFDRQNTPLVIAGRASAVRAESLDLEIRVALGRNPKETDFQTLAAKTRMDPRAVAADGSTLGTIDLRAWYDALSSSNSAVSKGGSVITLRIAATAHYPKEPQAIAVEHTRTVVLLHDDDLLLDAPLRVGASPTAAKVADVDQDSFNDVVLATSDGRVLALSASGDRLQELATQPIRTNVAEDFERVIEQNPQSPLFDGVPLFASGFARSSIPAAPAVGDLDLDGRPEIVVATTDGHLYALHADGSALTGWWPPIRLPPVDPNCYRINAQMDCVTVSPHLERGVSSSPVLADVNGDGRPEVLVAAHDGKVHAYESNGEPLAGWPVTIGFGPSTLPNRLVQSPAVGDFDGDSVDDLLVTAGESRSRDFGKGMYVLLLGSAANVTPKTADQWPIELESYDLLVDKLDRSTPGAAVDSSSLPSRALLYGNTRRPFFVSMVPGSPEDATETGSTELPSLAEPVSQIDGSIGFDLTNRGAQTEFPLDDTLAPLLARPSLGDLDRDGVPDLVLPGLTLRSVFGLRNNGEQTNQGFVAFWSGATGRMLPAAPVAVENFLGAGNAAIADLNNDGYPEVIVSDGGDRVLAFDACGNAAPGWPKLTGSRVSQSPAVGDIDGDRKLEVVVTTDDGWLYAWRTAGSADSYVPWASVQNDAANRSNLSDMGAGSKPTNPTRLRLDSAGRCVARPVPITSVAASQASARGGCGCEVVPNVRRLGNVAWFVGLVCLLLLRRERTHESTGAEGRT